MTFSYFVTAMLLVLPGHPARALSQTPWAASSGQRFMVSYPATWKHIDDEFAARLDVINQRSGAEGLLLKPGLAELIVSEDSIQSSIVARSCYRRLSRRYGRCSKRADASAPKSEIVCPPAGDRARSAVGPTEGHARSGSNCAYGSAAL